MYVRITSVLQVSPTWTKDSRLSNFKNLKELRSWTGGTVRLYMLDARKSKCNIDLIVGTCYMHNELLFVLFDCVTSHSFISTRCVERLDLELIALPFLMVVTKATNGNVETTWVCENCSVTISNRTFLIDLVTPQFNNLFNLIE